MLSCELTFEQTNIVKMEGGRGCLTHFLLNLGHSPKSLIMKSLSFRKVARFVAASCVVCVMALVFTTINQSCTKAPVPDETFTPLPSTQMPPMSGSGTYSAQINIWNSYTDCFYGFSILHRTVEMLTIDAARVAVMQNVVRARFEDAYTSLLKLDTLFVVNIQQMTNGNAPGAMLEAITPPDFSIYGKGPLNLFYMSSWTIFKKQINAIAVKADTSTKAGKNLKSAAEEFITKVDSSISIMNQVL